MDDSEDLAVRLRELQRIAPVRSEWVHRKGHRVVVTGHCLLEASASPAVLYVESGELPLTWARAGTEFLDGRFTPAGADRLTRNQKILARLALGLPNRWMESYQNTYRAAYVPDGPYGDWLKMVDAGLAERAPAPTTTKGGDVWRFWLTPEGAKMALEPGESLDLKNFPTVYQEALALKQQIRAAQEAVARQPRSKRLTLKGRFDVG